jgi:hypothetical protein
MARYDKIKRKSITEELMEMNEEAGLDWLAENGPKIGVAVGIALLVAAMVYGVIYYQKVTFNDAQRDLYSAASTAPLKGASRTEADTAIAELTKFADMTSVDETKYLALLDIAALQSRSHDPQSAVATYDKVITSADHSSLAYELALAGKGNELLKAGNGSDAIQPLMTLVAIQDGSYPKSDGVYSLAVAYTLAGDKEGAIRTLNKIKTEYPSYMDPGFIDDLIRRVETGEFLAMATKPDLSMDDADTAQPREGTDTTPRPIGVHNGSAGNGSTTGQ